MSFVSTGLEISFGEKKKPFRETSRTIDQPLCGRLRKAAARPQRRGERLGALKFKGLGHSRLKKYIHPPARGAGIIPHIKNCKMYAKNKENPFCVCVCVCVGGEK